MNYIGGMQILIDPGEMIDSEGRFIMEMKYMGIKGALVKSKNRQNLPFYSLIKAVLILLPTHTPCDRSSARPLSTSQWLSIPDQTRQDCKASASC